MPEYQVLLGDCLDRLKELPDASIDAVVTDPPYGLSDHAPKEVAACLSAWLAGEPYRPKGKGFMGKSWDAWVPGPEVWSECLRVLKPGGHILAFAGTRSMDLMSMAIRLAGFELRDSIGYAHDGGSAPLMAWTFGSGFPKSLDVSKAIDKAAGAEREVVHERRTGWAGTLGGKGALSGLGSAEDVRRVSKPATDAARQWEGWGTALKPAWEPIILARKPLVGTVAENVLAHGTGALNIDGCRVPAEGEENPSTARRRGSINHLSTRSAAEAEAEGKIESRQSPEAFRAGRAGEALGCWPANLIHDGSDGVVAAFPQAPGRQRAVGPQHGANPSINTYGDYGPRQQFNPRGDNGSAARFFYCAKASRRDRNEGCENMPERALNWSSGTKNPGSFQSEGTKKAANNNHPTVKPTDLMRYLCRLVTPPGGTVLDPFMGSGSTGKAAMLEGFRFIGIEREAGYLEIARARIQWAIDQAEPEPANDNNPSGQLSMFVS